MVGVAWDANRGCSIEHSLVKSKTWETAQRLKL